MTPDAVADGILASERSATISPARISIADGGEAAAARAPSDREARSSSMLIETCGSSRENTRPSAIVSSPSERMTLAEADQSGEESTQATKSRISASLRASALAGACTDEREERQSLQRGAIMVCPSSRSIPARWP